MEVPNCVNLELSIKEFKKEREGGGMLHELCLHNPTVYYCYIVASSQLKFNTIPPYIQWPDVEELIRNTKPKKQLRFNQFVNYIREQGDISTI